MPRGSSVVYPFSALVGQDALKDALLLNAVDPRIGGVLIRGHRGTAKSTAVRALSSILPEVAVVAGCPFACDPADEGGLCEQCRERSARGPLPEAHTRAPVVDLPISATEDRVVGTLDMEHALRHGERRFQPGLLASAHRGVLYVDEVNLLDDHLVDTLLDVAASGVNVVEREGVTYRHPSRFVLVGTMNPEEGELRPQLLDRFGLCVEVETIADPAERVLVMRRRRAFEEDPAAFVREWEPAERELTAHVAAARRSLPDIELDDDLMLAIARACASLGVQGHRADLAIARAAAARALLAGRAEVGPDDVVAVAPLALAHRLPRAPFHDSTAAGSGGVAAIRAAIATALEQRSPEGLEGSNGTLVLSPTEAAAERIALEGAGDTHAALPVDLPMVQAHPARPGRHHAGVEADTGRYVRASTRPPATAREVALDASIRAASLRAQDGDGAMAVRVAPEDLRSKVRRRRAGASIVFCVDASGSMSAARRMETAKAAIMELLRDAYQRRDRVGLVAFRGEGSEVVLQPTASVELARLKLDALPTGGATPIAHGILAALRVLEGELRREAGAVPWLVLVTDGRANVGLAGGLGSEDARLAATQARAAGVNTLVVDVTTEGSASARELARAAGGAYLQLPGCSGSALASAVRSRLDG